MNKCIGIFSVLLASACSLFQPPVVDHQAEYQAKVAAEKAAHQKKIEADAKRCEAGDDLGCAELFRNFSVLAQVTGDLQNPTKQLEAAMLLNRACSGGNEEACRVVADFNKKQARKAGLNNVTQSEFAQVQLGQTIDQVIEIVGPHCELVQKSALVDPKGQNQTYAKYFCGNTDGSGISLTLTNDRITQMNPSGFLPK